MLRFLGVIDDAGKPDKDKSKVFLQGDESFPVAFAAIVRDAYDELFDLHGDDAWTMDRQGLTQLPHGRSFRARSWELGRRAPFKRWRRCPDMSELPTVTQKKPAAKKATAPTKPKAAEPQPKKGRRTETTGELVRASGRADRQS